MASGKPAYGTGSQILRDAAVDIAKERGLSGLSLRNVAERGGVTHGLVRHHFGSRRGLVDAALEEASTRTHFLSDDGAPHISAHIEDTRGELRLQYEAVLSGEYVETIDRIYDDYGVEAKRWASTRGLPTDPVTLALIGAVVDGLSIGTLADPGVSAHSDAVVALLQELLSGARAGSTPAAEVPDPRG